MKNFSSHNNYITSIPLAQLLYSLKNFPQIRGVPANANLLVLCSLPELRTFRRKKYHIYKRARVSISTELSTRLDECFLMSEFILN